MNDKSKTRQRLLIFHFLQVNFLCLFFWTSCYEKRPPSTRAMVCINWTVCY